MKKFILVSFVGLLALSANPLLAQNETKKPAKTETTAKEGEKKEEHSEKKDAKKEEHTEKKEDHSEKKEGDNHAK